MRSVFTSRTRSASLSTVPPSPSSADYSHTLAKVAASILYRSPIRTKSGHPTYILNAAALPDTHEVNFDGLLPYVLARLPGEEELITGTEYEVIFLAGGNAEGSTTIKKARPGWGWFFQAYHVLSRAMRKRIQRLYIVHEKSWVRILVEMFSTIVSPKFRRKIVHGALFFELNVDKMLIPCYSINLDRSSPSFAYRGFTNSTFGISI
jgi:Rho GTPase-activating protein 1